MTNEEAKAIFTAIATANHHPTPAAWAEAALEAYSSGQPAPMVTEQTGG